MRLSSRTCPCLLLLVLISPGPHVSPVSWSWWQTGTGSKPVELEAAQDLQRSKELQAEKLHRTRDLSQGFAERHDLEVALHHDLTDVESAGFSGYLAMDIAVSGPDVFLLVQGTGEREDQILRFRKDGDGTILAKHPIGRNFARAIDYADDHLWVLSGRSSAFLRRFDPEGQEQASMGRPADLPAGKLYGLAVDGGTVYTSCASASDSTIVRFRAARDFYAPKAKGGLERLPPVVGGGVEQLHTAPGRIYSLTHADGVLYAYRKHFDTYASHWLLAYDLHKRQHQTLHFLHSHAWGLASDGSKLFYMRRRSVDGQTRAAVASFAAFPAEGVVVGRPLKKRVTLFYHLRNATQNPYHARIWVPKPTTRSFQKVTDLDIAPAPSAVETDEFGNDWLRFEWKNRTPDVTVRLSFTQVSVDAAFTLSRTYVHDADDVPRELRDLYTKPTTCFDHEHPYVQLAWMLYTKREQPAPAPSAPLLEQLIFLRDFTNTAIDVQYDDDGNSIATGGQSRASHYFESGAGRCYAHTLGFGAIARRQGIPTRAIGGLIVERSPDDQLYEDRSKWAVAGAVHTWNEVWFPGVGWCDIDSVADENDKKKLEGEAPYTFNYFAFHRRKYALTFQGSYDGLNYPPRDYDATQPTVFTERGWLKRWRWVSADSKNKAQVKLEINLEVSDLADGRVPGAVQVERARVLTPNAPVEAVGGGVR